MSLLYHAYVYLEFLILACTIYILAPCFIIGNHHTPSKIDGLDFQIQWEADLLENLTVMDKEKEQEKIKKCIDENFKTNTGKRIACSACHSYCGAACRRIG